MEFFNRNRAWMIAGLAALGVVLGWQLWKWEVERVEVPSGTFLVVTKLWGKDLDEGQIVAPDDTYKGVQRKMLAEGRHFLNPIFFTYEKQKVLEVPEGRCAVLARKAGVEIPAERKLKGEYLARGRFKVRDDEPDDETLERGILADVLLPGTYRVNPYEYSVELVPAVVIEANQVGVKTLRYGKDPKDLGDRRTSPYTVPEGYRGVQEKAVTQGVHYLNPYVASLTPVDVKSHPAEFKDISFPSRDGFTIQPHVLVAYKVVPEQAAELFVLLCDEGKLPQEDGTPQQQRDNPLLQKVVLPLIRGYVRIEGSKYEARDFVSQQGGAEAVNPREKLQEELMKKVAPLCKKVGVIIESITVAEFEPNADLKKLSEQIAEREQTRVARERNKKLVEQHKSEQEQKGKELLGEQGKRVVDANAKLKVEKTKAKQAMEVEEAKLKTELLAAQATLDASRETAKATLTQGKAEASVITANNQAEVAGLKASVEGFPSPDAFAQYHVVSRLSPALGEIFASDTSDFAKLFSGYMTPPRRGPVLAPPTGVADASPKK
ncbi:MAG: SPFH domain-containing protein [Gemmataceae bacterium]